MKNFQQFMSEAYPKSERKSHQPRLSFMGTPFTAPMPQIGAGKGVPLYIPKYQGPPRGEDDRGPGSFGKQTNKGKVTKRYHTNMPIQSGNYKKPDNIRI